MARDLKLQVVLEGLNRVSKPFKDASRSTIGLGRDLKETRAELKGLQAQQKDISSFRTLRGASDQTASALQDNRDKLRQLSRQLASTTTPSKELTRSFRAAVRESQALKTKHAEQKRELQGLRGTLNQAGISTSKLGQHERDLRTRISQTNQTISQQEARLKRLTAQQNRLAKAKDQYTRTQGLAGSMAGTGAGGLATGSGILYSGARMLAPGLSFDASMSKVQALSRLDKNSPDLQGLRDQARQLGASTQFTAGQAADAQGYLAMAGFAPNAIRAAMPGMLSLAKAGDAELADTADIASNILTGFNLQANDMGRLGDVLVGTFTRSNTNLQMLGDTMKYVAPVAAGVGQDIETVAAMAGKLGDAGIQGSMGGTALRAIISRLAKPPKMAAKALDALGISAKDVDGNLRDLPGLLQELYAKTEGMGNADRAGFLKSIAGEEAFSGLQVLVKQAGSGELQQFITTLRQARGEADKTAKVMGDNLKGDIDALGSAWEDLGIQMQKQQDGPLRGLTKGLTRVIGGVKSWIKENPQLAGQLFKTAAGLGLVMAGMGGLTLAMASILGPFAMVRYGLAMFGIRGAGLVGTLLNLGRTALPLVARGVLLVGRALMLNPIGLAVTAIGTAAYLIYRYWEPIKGFFTGLWTDVQAAFGEGIGGVSRLLFNWSPLGLIYRGITSGLSALGLDIPDKFKTLGGAIIDGLIAGLGSKLGQLKSSLTGIGDSVIGFFKDKLGIHSPSRVFAELGGYTMQGLSQGLNNGQAGPLRTLGGIAKNLTQAGALAFGVSNGAIAMDTRPPLSNAAGRAPVVVQGDSLNITINAAPGTDIAALRQTINQLLDDRERSKAARVRGALFDTE